MNTFENIKQELDYKYGVIGVSLEDDFAYDLGFDSLDRIELIMWVEKEYEIKINDFESEDINTVGELVKIIEDKFTCNCFTNVQKKRCKREC